MSAFIIIICIVQGPNESQKIAIARRAEDEATGQKKLKPMAFEGTIVAIENASPGDRVHRDLFIKLTNIQNYKAGDSCYSFSISDGKLRVRITTEHLYFPANVYTGYKTVKKTDSDSLNFYDDDGALVSTTPDN